jgi:putative salt-induced outer membrane protein YdiY
MVGGRQCLASLAAAVSLCTPALAAQPTGEPPAEDSVRAAEQALRNAVAMRDRDAIERLLASDFKTDSGSARDRSSWIDQQLRPCGGGPSTLQGLQILIDGDTALASSDAVVQFDIGCSVPLARTHRADVWTRQDGRWRLVLRTERSEPAPAIPLPLAAPPAQPAPFVGSLEVTILSTRGNVNTFTFGSTGELNWHRGQSRTSGRAAFLRTTSFGEERGRSVDLQLRQSRTVSPTMELFGRAVYQRDLFAGILQRYAVDAGVGLVAVHGGGRVQATFGAGTTHEVRLNVDSQSGPVATAGVQYRHVLPRGTTINVDVEATSYLNQGANWRVESTPGMTTVLRAPFSLRVSYAMKYINDPVPGFERLDAILSLGLLARF